MLELRTTDVGYGKIMEVGWQLFYTSWRNRLDFVALHGKGHYACNNCDIVWMLYNLSNVVIVMIYNEHLMEVTYKTM